MIKTGWIIPVCLMLAIFTFYFYGCKHDPLVPEHTVCFTTEVQPVFVTHCCMPGCHTTVSASHEAQPLGSYDEIMAWVVPGDPHRSTVYGPVSGHHEGNYLSGHEPSAYDAAIVHMWIEQGAINDTTCQ